METGIQRYSVFDRGFREVTESQLGWSFVKRRAGLSGAC